jgi:hypothetical protein
VQRTIRIWRPIVEHEWLLRSARTALPFVEVIGALF